MGELVAFVPISYIFSHSAFPHLLSLPCVDLLCSDGLIQSLMAPFTYSFSLMPPWAAQRLTAPRSYKAFSATVANTHTPDAMVSQKM